MSGADDTSASRDAQASDKATLERLKAAGKLPTPKGVALEVMRLSRQEYVSNAQIARVIQADPALTGRLIRAANVATRGGKRPVIAVSDAVLVLGLSVVWQLALGFSLLSENRKGASKHFDYQNFWSRSLLMGTAMQAIALHVRLANPEETFACGLLARIGELALVSVYPAECDQVMEQAAGASEREIRALECERLGIDHVQLTVLLLLDLGFPDLVSKVALDIDQPEAVVADAQSRSYLFAQAMRLADRLSTTALAQGAQRRQLLPDLLRTGARLGMDGEILQSVLDEVMVQWHEWGRLLQVPTHDVPPLTETPEQAVGVEVVVRSASGAETKPVHSLRVLAVDDDQAIQAVLKRFLTLAGHTVYTASNGNEALERALEVSPDLVITDWVMPGMDGLQLCRALRATKLGKSMYILMLTSFEDEERTVEAFEAGADDYVNKPFSPRALGARLRAAQRVLQLQEELQRDAEEIRRFAAELAVNNRRLQQAAMTDSLTDLPNRRYALDRLEQERAAAQRRKAALSCVLIDVDNFKSINDAHGHEGGDAVLRHVANRLRQGARAQDSVARIGGDEILLICPDAGAQDAFKCAERLRNLVVASPIVFGERRIDATVSLGVATASPDMQNISELMARADQALYRAKRAGRNRTCLWVEGQDSAG